MKTKLKALKAIKILEAIVGGLQDEVSDLRMTVGILIQENEKITGQTWYSDVEKNPFSRPLPEKIFKTEEEMKEVEGLTKRQINTYPDSNHLMTPMKGDFVPDPKYIATEEEMRATADERAGKMSEEAKKEVEQYYKKRY